VAPGVHDIRADAGLFFSARSAKPDILLSEFGFPRDIDNSLQCYRSVPALAAYDGFAR
jgi:hypothetical protein